MADEKPKAKSAKGNELYVVVVAAVTNDGPISNGEIAEAGSVILKKYPALFAPLTITYRA